MTLHSLGWSAFLEAQFLEAAKQDPNVRPCRVVSEGTNQYRVHDGNRETLADVRGRLRDQPEFPPSVGDWVLAQPIDGGRYIIEQILARRTAIVRRDRGATSPQMLAANVDRVMLVTSVNRDFSVRRLERYLTLVWESGATPVIVLTKADLVDDITTFHGDAERCALGFPVISVSNVSGDGIDQLRSQFRAGETVVLVGSSGVGKSTLINVLAESNIRATSPIREKDGKGRHTTTNRHLVQLPTGLIVIDTPGLRAVPLWANQASVEQTFPELADLAANCRFRDCQHSGEPGCAVKAGIDAGTIAPGRLESLHRLRREVAYQERQTDAHSARQYKQRIKQIMRAQEKQQRYREKP